MNIFTAFRHDINMCDYVRSYNEFCSTIDNVQSHMNQGYYIHYEIIEELLGFHCWLYEQMTRSYDNLRDKHNDELPNLYIHNMFAHNIITAHATFLEIQQNLYHPARSHMRNIVESIPKMYYMAFYPNEIKYAIVRDITSGIRDNKEKRKIIKHGKIEYDLLKYIDANIYNDTDDIGAILEESKSKYYFKWYLDRVYTNETKKILKQFYSRLNISTHADLRRKIQEYNAKEIESTFMDLIVLLFYSIVAEIEGQQPILTENKHLHNESKDFICKIKKKINKVRSLPLLYPDHDNVRKKRKIS